MQPQPLQSRFLFEARVDLGPIRDLGQTPAGNRRIIDIIGGSFAGPELRGQVLPGGADWQVVRPDGVTFVDARYSLQTDGGALIYVQNRGLRHGPPEVMARLAAGDDVPPDQYYFRTQALFETAAADLQWLNQVVVMGTGARRKSQVVLSFYQVL